MKKFFVVVFITAFVFSGMGSALAAEKKTTAATPRAAAKATATPQTPQAPHRVMPRENIGMVFGSITKIDTSDPAVTKIEITNPNDKKISVVEALPQTNVAKITDLTELKTGETVRIMTRKVDDKQIAMSIVFGKVRTPPMMTPMAQRPAIPVKSQAQETVKAKK